MPPKKPLPQDPTTDATSGPTTSTPAAPRQRTRATAASPSAPSGTAPKKLKKETVAPVVDQVDTRYLQTLMGYNARRAALSIIELFLERLAPYGLKPVDFSVMSTIGHNPGVTSRQLCATLNLLPPNLVGLIQSLESRGLIERQPHPHDGRAVGLHATPKGLALMQQAEITASELELEKTAKLTPAERKTLLSLLQKIYL
jgi:DNA-binding MarR family transcriptional regulator